MTLVLTTNQQSKLTVVMKDANGMAIELDEADPLAPQPRWTEDSKGTVVEICAPDGDYGQPGVASNKRAEVDGLVCVVKGVGPGTAVVTCSDRGTNKLATETVTVKPGGIASIVILAEQPTRKTAPLVVEPVIEPEPDQLIEPTPAEPPSAWVDPAPGAHPDEL